MPAHDPRAGARHFDYELDHRFKAIWWPLGVREGQGVTIDDDRLTARYGRLELSTPLDNVVGGHLTEHYRWYTAIGVRLSFVDDGLTFGTSTRRGVCIHFADRVGGVIPGRSHSALTVTVADCAGLIDLIGDDAPS